MDTRSQGITLFTAIWALIATLVIIQLWLLAAALDALLGGHTAVLLPAAVASLVLFLVNGAILLHALNFDHRIRDGEASQRG